MSTYIAEFVLKRGGVTVLWNRWSVFIVQTLNLVLTYPETNRNMILFYYRFDWRYIKLHLHKPFPETWLLYHSQILNLSIDTELISK